MKYLITTITLLVSVLWTSSAYSGGPWSEQYCNLKTETINTVDSNGMVIDSKTTEVLVCDDSVKDFLAYSGIAKECREYYYHINLKGYLMKKKGYVCEKLDGSFEIVHPRVN